MSDHVVPAPASAGAVSVMSGSAGGARPGLRAGRRRRLDAFRAVVLVLATVFFMMPTFAMLEFSTRGIGDAGRTLDAWKRIATYPDLVSAIVVSLELSVLTSVASLVLMVPTMIWVRLRAPRLNRLIDRPRFPQPGAGRHYPWPPV